MKLNKHFRLERQVEERPFNINDLERHEIKHALGRLVLMLPLPVDELNGVWNDPQSVR